MKEKPRLRFDLNELEPLPERSFGKQYYNWMRERHFIPEERPIVKYISEFVTNGIRNSPIYRKDIKRFTTFCMCYSIWIAP